MNVSIQVADFLQGQRLPITAAVRIAVQVASAVAHIHGQQYVYGSLDAEHVVLMNHSTEDPIAKLSDFSNCQRNPHGGKLLTEELADFLAFMKLLLWDGSNRSAIAKDMERPQSSVIAGVNNLMSSIESGNMSAKEITMKLMMIDIKLQATVDQGGTEQWSL